MVFHLRLGLTLVAAAACAASVSHRAQHISDAGRAAAGVGKVALLTEPDEQGKTLLEAIGSARQSVDVSIYSIGDERILQALKRAKANGATIRLMVNGQNWIEPANYPGHQKYDGVYALMCGYSPLSRAGGAGDGQYAAICPAGSPQVQGLQQAPGSGIVMLHATSNDVALTHQKTVLVDAVTPDGRPLWPKEMLPSSKVLVLTGNLSGYPWPNCAVNGVWDPSSCPFYSARDFGLAFSDSALIAEIERVFTSDWNCHSPCENNGLLQEPVSEESGVLLVWANGIGGMPGTYPDCDNQFCPPGALYPSATRTGEGCDLYATGDYPSPLFGPSGSCGGTIQGNARRELLALIGSAKKTLDVYNEEMADEDLVTALAARASAGLRVRVVMTEGNPHTYWSEAQGEEVDSFQQLAAASAQIHLFPNSASALYIHAKVILADVPGGGGQNVLDRASAYVGSENISTASLNQNRELGVILGAAHHRETLRALARVFEGDFGQAPITPGSLSGPGAARSGPGNASRDRREPRRERCGEISSAESSAPLACGPQGFPFPRPTQEGFGPWNPGH